MANLTETIPAELHLAHPVYPMLYYLHKTKLESKQVVRQAN